MNKPYSVVHVDPRDSNSAVIGDLNVTPPH